MQNKLSYTTRNPLAELAVGLRTELIKMKRTAIPWVIVLGPLAVAAMMFFIGFNSTTFFKNKPDPWAFYVLINLTILAFLFLPNYLALLPTQVYANEHNNNTWKLLYALPTPRWALFWSKLITIVLALLVSMLVFVLSIYMFGNTLVWLGRQPVLGQHTLDWYATTRLLTDIFLASLPMVVIHNWLSFRFKSFGVAIGVAILGSASATIAMQGWQYTWLHPYALPMLQTYFIGGNVKLEPWQIPAWLGIGQALVLLALSFWDIHRRPVR